MIDNWADLLTESSAQLDHFERTRRLKVLARRAAYIVAMTLGLIAAYWIVGGAQ